MSEARRPKRVAETIRKHLAEALARELFDPRLQGLIVTRVDIGSDLALAHVYVRALSGVLPTEQQAVVVQTLDRVLPRLRHGLGPKLGTRRLPELRAHYDADQDAVDRIEAILQEIRSERPPPDGEQG
jgi:ribosome-binding factor A